MMKGKATQTALPSDASDVAHGYLGFLGKLGRYIMFNLFLRAADSAFLKRRRSTDVTAPPQWTAALTPGPEPRMALLAQELEIAATDARAKAEAARLRESEIGHPLSQLYLELAETRHRAAQNLAGRSKGAAHDAPSATKH